MKIFKNRFLFYMTGSNPEVIEKVKSRINDEFPNLTWDDENNTSAGVIIDLSEASGIIGIIVDTVSLVACVGTEPKMTMR